MEANRIIAPRDLILVTGANGFIGRKVVESLIAYGYSNLRCFVRPSSNVDALRSIVKNAPQATVEMITGNLLSRQDAARAAKEARIVFHLAAGSTEKSYAGCFMNSAVTTRNLLDEVLISNSLKRFVNISSFAVYSNWHIKRHGWLDETCELENKPMERADAYSFAKLKQEQLVAEYGRKHGLPYVILRPGAVYGPGAKHLNGRVGISTFGVFLHLGGRNEIPFTYIDNCADAIVRAGIVPCVDGEVFNVVDDDLPTSRQFLRMYKKYGKPFKSIYLPYSLAYGLCWAWETYSKWSKNQLPPVFNRRRCAAQWKGNRYSNRKLKDLLGWRPGVPYSIASKQYFAFVREVS